MTNAAAVRVRLALALSLAVALVVFAQCRSTPDDGARAGDSAAADATAAVTPAESPADHDARMQWWREARFGMFVHWGLYAIPAGAWGKSNQHGEWIRDSAHIPVEEYETLQPKFDPQKYDPRVWASLAKRAGMRYVVITSKHHDGFGLWDSPRSDWDMGGTPSKRDILGELKTACDSEELRFCTYHSIMDWHHPDYLPRRPWEKRSTDGAQFPRYVDYLHAQVGELITRYHPAVMWFDGEWESTWTHELGVSLYAHCRALDPALIINNRVDVSRDGTGGFSSASGAVGDFSTPEQEVPAKGLPGVDWETCMTMNNHWGYCAADAEWKPLRTCIRTLVDVASKGGNFLFNVGPRADGTFPPEAVERLEGIGRWMDVNGDAIHGTQASPMPALTFGRCTQRAIPGGTRLFLHVFDWPQNGELVVPGIGNEARTARLLAGGAELPVARRGDALVVAVPKAPPDADCSVVALDISGAPLVYEPPTIAAPTSLVVGSLAVEVRAPAGLDVRYTLDGSEPTATSAAAAGAIAVSATTTIKARSFHDGRAVSPVVQRTFTATVPKPGDAAPAGGEPGVRYLAMDGTFDRLPPFPVRDRREATDATATRIAPAFALPTELRREHVAALFWAHMYVPETSVWVFELTSDDGSRLWVDDAATIDHDGPHGATARRGEIALAKGWHAVRVGWFNRTGGAELKLTRAVAGRPQAAIPPDHLRVAKSSAR